MPTFLVTGYKNFELGIFSEKDPKLQVIKTAIRKDLVKMLEEGVDWFIFQGNLGFEHWCLSVAKELKEEYAFQMACIFPFANHGESWSESNQIILQEFKQLDYVNHSFLTYTNPGQLAQHQEFLMNHSDGAYLFYDSELETSLKYFDQKVRAREDYDLYRLDFERLNEIAQEMD